MTGSDFKPAGSGKKEKSKGKEEKKGGNGKKTEKKKDEKKQGKENKVQNEEEKASHDQRVVKKTTRYNCSKSSKDNKIVMNKYSRKILKTTFSVTLCTCIV